MQRSSWSTISAEQAHASLSLMAKRHATAGLPSLIPRSHLHQARALFGRPGHPSSQPLVPKAPKPKQLWRIGSRQAFLAAAYSALKHELGRPLTKELRDEVMRRHAVEFAELSPEQREYYDMKAKELQAKKEQEIEEQMTMRVAGAQIQALRNHLLEQSSSPVASKLLNAVMTDAEIYKLMSTAAELSEVPQSLRQGNFYADGPPSALMKEQLSEHPADEFIPEFPLVAPLWAALVCRHRDQFRNSILALPDLQEDGLNFYLVLFAMQKPYVLVLAPLQAVTDVAQVADDELSSVVRKFKWDGSSVVDAATLLPHDVREVWVHPAAAALGDWFFRCDPVCFSLSVFVGEHAQAKAARKVEKHGQATKIKPPADDVAKFPWLSKYTNTTVTTKTRPRRSVAGAVEVEDDEPLSPDAVNKAFATLQEKRAEWSFEKGDETEHFRTVVRGGAWTQAHRQVAVDSIAAQAASSAAKAFCVQFGLPKLASYSYAKFGERVAKVLAQGWVHKMTFLHTVFLEADDVDYHFGHDILQSYEFSADIVNLKAELGHLHKGVRDRIEQLESLKPATSALPSSS